MRGLGYLEVEVGNKRKEIPSGIQFIMKKLLSLSLLAGGFLGSMIAGAAISSHMGNVSTSSFSHVLTSEKNQTVAFIRLPDPTSPNRPS